MLKLNNTLLEPNAADPGASAPPAADPAPESTGVNWESFADDPPEESPATPDGAGASPAAPAAVPPPVEAPAPAPSPTPGTEPAPAAAPATPTPPPTPATPDPAAVEAERQATIEAGKKVEAELTKLFESDFDEDTKAALLSNPEAVMGKLMAKAAMYGAQMALHQVPRMIPQMVAQTARTEKAVSSAWDAFDKANQDLAKPEYRQSVAIAAQSLKASGQKLTDEQAVAALGRMVRAMHGLPDAGAPAPAAPAPAPVPFTPVARGGAAPAAHAKASGGIDWAEFATPD